MKNVLLASALGVGLAFGFAGVAKAVVAFNQNVTPDVIFGTGGNVNGFFTTDRRNGIELGIRAKNRETFTFNSNGDGTYDHISTESLGPPPADRWSYEWTVNTDYLGTSGLKINDFTYELGLDGDPGPGTNFMKFDPITPTARHWDHSFGDNTFVGNTGLEANPNIAGTAPIYVGYMDTFNVLQQSWRYDFNPYPPLNAHNLAIPGTYAVYLLARDSMGKVVARVDIQVLVDGARAVVQPKNKKECKHGGWRNPSFYPAFTSKHDCEESIEKDDDDDHD